MGRSWLWASGVGIGLAFFGAGAAVAETAVEGVEAQAESRTLFVHPERGSDRATGDESAPLQTITQALELATPGTTIVLAPGRYSRDTGERFPLQLSDGITLKGNVSGYGDGIVIHGGGSFTSTLGQQHVAIVASGQSALQGVTLSNPRGHGLWVEQGALRIGHCLFWGNQRDGVAIAGDSRPLVQHSRFYQNRGHGISVAGSAAPLIRTNRIEAAGYGIAVREQATPRLLQNYISGNRIGVLVQGRSRPVLRQNHITRNREDGVVALAQAQPDLGTQGQPGENQFDGNGGYAINAGASEQIVVAAGNRFATAAPRLRLAGRIDLNGVVSRTAIARQTPIPTAGDSTVARRLPRPISAAEAPTSRPSDALNAATPLPVAPAARPAAQLRPAVAQRPGPLGTVTVAATAIAPRRTALRTPAPAVAPAARNENLLPVPTATVPLGYLGSTPTLAASSGGSYRRPRYRVLVNIYSTREQALVEAIAPGAFVTRINGRTAMQAGAYHRVENANQMMQQLARTGLRAEVLQMQ